MTQVDRRTALRTLSAAGLAAAGTTAGLASPAAAGPPRGRGRELRVLSINIWLGGSKIEDGLSVVADLIQRTRASLVLLSESGPATAEIADLLDRRGERFQAVSSDDTGILSRYPVRRTAALKWITKAVVEIGRQEVAVYAGHLIYTNYACYLPRGYGAGVPAPGELSEYGWDKIPSGPITDVATIERVNRASGRPEAITAFVEDADAERRRGRPAILGGDFNEPSELDWTRATRNLWDHHGVVIPWESTRLLHEAGFVDAYRERYPDPVTHPGHTWPASNPDAKLEDLVWTPEADERDRIDFVFARHQRGLRLRSAGMLGPRASVVRGRRVDERTQDRYVLTPRPWVSDHKAVLATYDLR